MTQTVPTTDAVLQERGSRYGAFHNNAYLAQRLKGVMHNAPAWCRTSDSQREALEMIQHKIARMLNGDPRYEDNVVDIIGYATLMLQDMRRDKNNAQQRATEAARQAAATYNRQE